MILTKKQEQGLKIAVERYRNHERYTVISGYAGSGKSTLVSFIIDALDINPDLVCYCAYTGRAAKILGQKTNANAITAHKLLYEFYPIASGGFKRKRRNFLDYKLIIVDECGMLPSDMAKELLRHRESHVIFLGDPGQLPPISEKDNNHLLDNPHVFLDEIMRQAQDSGIIRLSMLIREGKPFGNFKSDDAIVLPKKELSDGMLSWADITICATNQTRAELNNYRRGMLGRTEILEEGELVMNLRNNWDVISPDGEILTNGTLGYVHEIYETFWTYPSSFKISNDRVDVIHANLYSETGQPFSEIFIDKQLLLTGVPTLTPQQIYKIKNTEKYSSQIPNEFAYGYVATCWKFQGGQAPNVLGLEEKHPYDREEHKKYLYTLVTRAEEKCVLLRK